MTNREEKYGKRMYELLSKTPQTEIQESFTKYVRRQQMARFLAMHEIFLKVREVKGSIVDAGCYRGFSSFAWLQFMAAYCPYSYQDRVICFDSYEGFPEIGEKDTGVDNPELKVGAFGDVDLDGQKKCAELFQLNHPLYHLKKIEFVKGDINVTVPRYIENNQHLLIKLLYIDTDLFEPAKTLLVNLVPRMSRGSIIIFDEAGNSRWPGETMAMLEGFDLPNNRLECFSYEPNLSYMTL